MTCPFALKSSARSNKSEFKSTFEILQDISNIWGTLTDVQQAEVTRLVAGVRQGQVMAALMQGMGSAADAATTALNSYGSAMRENEIWMRSLEGRIARFNTAFEATASKMLNSGIVGFFADAGRVVAQFFGLLDGWVGKAVAIPVVIAGITGALRELAGTRVIGGIWESIKGLADIPANLGAMKQMFSLMREGNDALSSFAKATKGLTDAQILQTAAKQKNIIVETARQKVVATGAVADKVAVQAQIQRDLVASGLNATMAEQVAMQALSNAKIKAGVVANAGIIASTKAKIVAWIAAKNALLGVAAAWALTPMGMVTIAVGAFMAISAAIRSSNQDQEEQNRLTRERAQTAREELRNLDELITRYRQLRTAMVFDESARTEVRDIQEQITNLVGEQARNLDLVNGGLSEQLHLLNTIQREQAIAARNAVEIELVAARRAANTATANNRRLNSGNFWNPFSSGHVPDALRRAGLLNSPGVNMNETGGIQLRGTAEEQIAILERWSEAFLRLQRNGTNVTNAINIVNGELESLRAALGTAEEAQRRLFDTALAASRHGSSLSIAQTDFIRNIVQTTGMDNGEEISRLIDRLGNDAVLQSAIDNLFTFQPGKQSVQATRDNIRQFAEGLLNTLPNDVRALLGNITIDDFAIMLRPSLAFVLDEEEANRMKELIQSRVADKIEGIDSFSARDLQLAYDIALNIDQNSIASLEKFNAMFAMSRASVEALNLGAEQLNNTISEFAQNWSLIRSLENEMMSTGGLSVDSISTVIDRFGESYLKFLYEAGGQIRFNAEAFRQSLIEQQQASVDALRQSRASAEEALAQWKALSEVPAPEINITGEELREAHEGNVQLFNDLAARIEAHKIAVQNWEASIARANFEIENHTQKVSNLNHKLELYEIILSQIVSEQNNYIDTLSRMNTAISTSAAAMEEMSQSGHISFETFRNLAEITPNIADYITNINGRLVLNTEAWNHNQAATNLARQALQEYMASLPPAGERTRGHMQILEYLHDQYMRLRDGVRTTSEIMGQAVAATDNLSSAFSTLTGAIDEFNEHGDLQITTVQRLLALGDDYLDLLEFSHGRIVLNTSAIDAKVDALREEMIAAQQAALAEEIRTIQMEEARLVTNESISANERMHNRLVNTGRQALTTAEQFGTLAAAIQITSVALDYLDDSGNMVFEQASQRVIERVANAIENAQNRINLINAMGTTGERALRGAASGGASSSNNDPWLDAANHEIAELRWLHERRLISEQIFLDRLNQLNQRFFAGRAQYLEQWRRLEIEVVNGVQRVWEENLNHRIAQASRNDDLQGQIALYRELQNNLHETANRFRELGFDETSNEIMTLQSRWWDAHESIIAVVQATQRAREENINLRSSLAGRNDDLQEQVELYRELYVSLQTTTDKLRGLGFDDTGTEMLQMQTRILDVQQAINQLNLELVNLDFDGFMDGANRELDQLNFQLRMLADNDVDRRIELTNRQLQIHESAIERASRHMQDLIQAYNQGRITSEQFRAATDAATQSLQQQALAARQAAESAIQLQLGQLNQQQSAMMGIVNLTKQLIQQEARNQIAGLNDEIANLQARQNALRDIERSLADAQRDRNRADQDRRRDMEEELRLQRDLAAAARQRLQDELSAYRDLINLRRQALNQLSEARRFEQDLAERQLDVQRITDRLAEIENNDSMAARAERARLNEELRRSQLNLDNLIFDNDIQRQRDALDSELDRYTRANEAERRAIDDALAAFERAHRDRLALMDRERQAHEDMHNAQLENLRNQGEAYNAQADNIRDQIADIQARIQNNGDLTRKAMQRIDREGENLYRRLIEWNRIYGTGIDEDVSAAWQEFLRHVDRGNETSLEFTARIMREILSLTQQIVTMQSQMSMHAGSMHSASVGLRNHFENQGRVVDWNPNTNQFSVDGNWFDSDSFVNLDGRLQATHQQLLELERQLRNLPHYDKGGFIDRDQLAVVHAGERVLTREQNKQWESGKLTPLNITAVPKESFAQMLAEGSMSGNRPKALNPLNLNNLGGAGSAPAVTIEMHNQFDGVTTEELPNLLQPMVKRGVDAGINEHMRKTNRKSRDRGVVGRVNAFGN